MLLNKLIISIVLLVHQSSLKMYFKLDNNLDFNKINKSNLKTQILHNFFIIALLYNNYKLLTKKSSRYSTQIEQKCKNCLIHKKKCELIKLVKLN